MIGVKDVSTTLPFIHLFKTPQNFYFYDVNRNETIQIEKDVYAALKDEQECDDKDIKALVAERIEELKEQGYLSANRPRVLKHPETDNLSTYLNRNLSSVVLQLTQSCNFRCIYCPYTQENSLTRNHEDNYMSWEVAKQTIDFLHQHSVDSNYVSINFYGGEPLLQFDLIKKCVEYCHKAFNGKEHIFGITTNGTLLTDEICKYMEKESFSILVSLDGIKSTNDKNRKFKFNSEKSTFDKVIKKLRYINDHYPKLFKKVSINMVIDPSVPFVEYKELLKNHLFLKDTQISAILIDDSLSEKKNTYSDEFQEQFSYDIFMSYLHSIGRYNLIEELGILKRNIDSNANIFSLPTRDKTLGKINAPGGPCIPGKHRMLVDVDGKIYP